MIDDFFMIYQGLHEFCIGIYTSYMLILNFEQDKFYVLLFIFSVVNIFYIKI